MIKHEEKYCPLCHSVFECKAGNITQCMCAGVVLTETERAYISERFTDCLCINCLLEIKKQFAVKGKEVDL